MRLPDDNLQISGGSSNVKSGCLRAKRILPDRAQKAARLTTVLLPQRPVPLAVVSPSDELSPGKAWTRIAARVARTPWRHANYAQPYGYGPLREAVADYARKFRGVVCQSEQVIITAGTQQAMNFCSQLLFERGDTTWVEDPCYSLLTAAIAHNGVRAIPIAVNADGLDVAAGIASAPDARGAFVTPSHQYPLGMAMSMERRLALLEWAYQANSWIVEDDYDSELRYEGSPFPALQGLDPSGEAVVYLGTFSKMLFPGLRLGYVIVPKSLIEAFAGARVLADRHSSEVPQAVLAEYMQEGHYEAHVRRIRSIFEKRRRILMDECEIQLSSFGKVVPGDQGMHVVFQFTETFSDVSVASRVRARGVEVRPLSPFYHNVRPLQGLLLGFGGFASQAIESAVQIIRRQLESVR